MSVKRILITNMKSTGSQFPTNMKSMRCQFPTNMRISCVCLVLVKKNRHVPVKEKGTVRRSFEYMSAEGTLHVSGGSTIRAMESAACERVSPILIHLTLGGRKRLLMNLLQGSVDRRLQSCSPSAVLRLEYIANATAFLIQCSQRLFAILRQQKPVTGKEGSVACI